MAEIFGYQIGNFATTILLLGAINICHGARAAAQITSIELFSGIIGTALLRYPMMIETKIHARALVDSINRARIICFSLGAILCVALLSSPQTITTAILSLAATCFTPAFELLRTNYRTYASHIVIARLVATGLVIHIDDTDAAVWIYFLAVLVPALSTRKSTVRNFLSQATPEQAAVRQSGHWEAFTVSLMSSFFVAVASQRIITEIAKEQGLLVTIERVSRACIAFLFPYIYKFTAHRKHLSYISVATLLAIYIALIYAPPHKYGVNWAFALIPALLSFGSTWSLASRTRDPVPIAATVLLSLICYSLW